jgi:hypothetical protein
MDDARKIYLDAWAAENEMRDPFEPLQRAQPQPIRTPEPTQAQPDWTAWDNWCAAHVQNGLERAAEIFGEEVHEIEADLLKRIELLEQKVGELAAESEVRHCAEVFDLPDFRRKKNNGA